MRAKATYWKTQIVNEQPVKLYKIAVHAFKVDDYNSDPEILAAQPLYDWERSEEGQWIMKNAVEIPTWHKYLDHKTYSTKFSVIAVLRESDYVAWSLKFE